MVKLGTKVEQQKESVFERQKGLLFCL